jgi:hypothetical protein
MRRPWPNGGCCAKIKKVVEYIEKCSRKWRADMVAAHDSKKTEMGKGEIFGRLNWISR